MKVPDQLIKLLLSPELDNGIPATCYRLLSDCNAVCSRFYAMENGRAHDCNHCILGGAALSKATPEPYRAPTVARLIRTITKGDTDGRENPTYPPDK